MWGYLLHGHVFVMSRKIVPNMGIVVTKNGSWTKFCLYVVF